MLSFGRRLAFAQAVPSVGRALGATRYASNRPEKQSPESGPFENAADYLTSLGEKPATEAEADKEAAAWLEAIKEVGEEFRPGGESFRPSKVFAPAESQDYNILKDHVQTQEAFQPSPPQHEQFAKLQDKAIPSLLDETMDYLASVIMRDGKKARARRYLNEALYLVYLRTRKDPVQQVKRVLEQMGPLVRLKRFSDGGARTELVPRPLTERQRLRQAWNWILEASDRRQSKDFSVRLSEEILSAINGRSPGFEKKVQQHKMAITNRAYISLLNK